jgi:hypothetical protein
MKHWDKINELHKRFKEENPNEEIYETTKEHRMFHTERYVIWLQNKVSELQSENGIAVVMSVGFVKNVVNL